MSKFFVSIFFMHLLSAFLWADAKEIKVVLENGDRLSGELISENEQELHLKVGYLGEVKVKRSHIAKIEGRDGIAKAEGKPDASQKERSAEMAKSEAKPKPKSPRPDAEKPKVAASAKRPPAKKAAGAKGAAVVATAEPAQKEKGGLLGVLADWQEEFNPMPKWKKNLQFGYNSTSGRKDLSTLNYRLDMSRKIEKNRLNFNADYAYGEANGTTNLDKYSTKFRWRKDISPGVFYETQTVYSADAIKLIDSNIEQKFGLGRRLLDSKGSTLSAGFGASGRWREIAEKETQGESLVNVFQDWDYRLTDKVRLKQDFKVAMPLDETDDYEVDFAASLRSDVTKSINLSIRFQLGYDNSLPDDRKEDRRLISALGYAF